MGKKSQPVIVIEYMCVRALLWIFHVLPIRIGLALGRAIGTLAWLVDARHRRVAMDNLAHAYGDELTPKARRRLVRRVFQHFAMLVPEVAKLPQLVTRDSLSECFEFENFDAIDRALALGKGAVFVSAHLGNWEVLGVVTSLRGYDLTTIARPLDNPMLDRLVNGFRERYGQKIVPKTGALRAMVQVMKRRGILTFVADQNARDNHVFVDFFGRPAATVKSVAALALRDETPIVFGFGARQGPGFRYRVIVDDPILPKNTGDKEADVLRITQAFTKRIEYYVRQYPEQWLWLHRRWKTQPPASATDAPA